MGTESVLKGNVQRQVFSLLKYIRFDNKDTRQSRLRNDKFALFSDIWERFIENSQKHFNPGPFMTIDEQLYPTKVRCRFIQYMSNKPDKFGIKFFLLANIGDPYIFNGFPYLGADDTKPADLQMAHHVVNKLIRPYLNGGYNITTDNFFTSKKLATECLSNNITVIGTIRSNRRELPTNLISTMNSAQLHSTVLYESDGCILTSYKCKTNKAVHLLSTYHEKVENFPPKNKPSTVIDYNNTKYGVDVIDQMARYHTCKVSSRRWPVQVFCNVLDLATINAQTLFTSVRNSNITRRNFILQLVSELVDVGLQSPANQQLSVAAAVRVPNSSATRRKCQIKMCNGNKAASKCSICKLFTCGKCRIDGPVVCQKCVQD